MRIILNSESLQEIIKFRMFMDEYRLDADVVIAMNDKLQKHIDLTYRDIDILLWNNESHKLETFLWFDII